MKKNQTKTVLAIFGFAFLSIQLFVGCSKTSNSNTEIQETKNVNSVLNQRTLSAFTTSYSLLSNKERQKLWEDKINVIYKNNNGRFTKEQLSIINSIKNMLTQYGVARLRENPEIGNKFLESNLSYFRKHFTAKQLFFLIQNPYFNSTFSILDVQSSTSNQELSSDDNTATVDCACLYDIGCETTKTCDKSTNCTPKQDCGLFGTSNCTGNCK